MSRLYLEEGKLMSLCDYEEGGQFKDLIKEKEISEDEEDRKSVV